MIQLTNVSIKNKIKNITLTLRRGEFLGLVGANGAGKTTLLELMNGSLLPNSGQVNIGNLSTFRETDLPEIRRRVSLVRADPESQLVAPTVFEEIAFGLRSQAMPIAELMNRAEQAMLMGNLTELRDIHPFFLSAGEQHRLMLAALTVTQPDYLLLDEVTSMMDSQVRQHTLNYLKSLRHQYQFGVFMATHRLEDVLHADRIAILSEGKLVACDTSKNIIRYIQQFPDLAIDVPILTRLAEDYPKLLGRWLPESSR